MGTVEIIMLLCGIAFLILSFFVGNEKMSQHHEVTDADLFSAERISEIKKELEASIEETADDVLEDAKNKLASASNETIISVDDFSRQTLERINHNHEEVVFMYNMLQNKEEELKKNLEELKQTFDELEKKKDEVKNDISAFAVQGESGIEIARKKTAAKNEQEKMSGQRATEKRVSKNTSKKSIKESVIPKPIADNIPLPETMVEAKEMSDDNKTAKILELYQKKKSVLEISKALGLGQGEVKLVIDLYGKNY